MKRFLAFLMIFCMFVGLTACGSSESTPSGDEQPGQQTGEPEYEWTLAHHLAEASQQHKGFLKFADDVYEKSGGRIKINISFGAALGSQRELIEQVNLGTIEMALGEASLLANYCKAFGLICAPFTFIDENQYIDVASNVINDDLNTMLAANSNLRNIAWLYGGTRDVYATKPLTSLDDLQDLKIRTPESPAFVEGFTALGANPTAIAANEMYTSIQQGVVEAMEGSLETAYTYKIYEVAKNCLRTSHILAGCDLVMNNNLYESLPDDLKDIITECAAEMVAYEGQLVAETDSEYYAMLEDEGVIFTDLSEEERARAVEMTAGFVESYIDGDAEMQAIYDKIAEATA